MKRKCFMELILVGCCLGSFVDTWREMGFIQYILGHVASPTVREKSCAPKHLQGYSQNFAAERDRFLMSLQVDSQRKLPQKRTLAWNINIRCVGRLCCANICIN